MNLSRAGLKSLKLLVTQGPSETARVLLKNVRQAYWKHENRKFDKRYGVDTAGAIEPAKLQIDSNNRGYGVRYEATPLKTFSAIMRNMPADPKGFTFVDFGSGKGRTLLLASHFGFQKIIGVEYARELHEVAERNIRTYRDTGQLCRDLQSIHCDASEFSLPLTSCICYFFQPFSQNVMGRVLDNIDESIARVPRPVYLVLFLPHQSVTGALAARKFWQRLLTKRLPFDLANQYERELAIYAIGQAIAGGGNVG